jgi:hypothetical protein
MIDELMLLPRWLLSIDLRLATIHVPASAEVLCTSRFSHSKLLASVTFDSDSELQRIEEYVFQWNGLIAIYVPVFVEVLYKLCLSDCESLSSIIFESHSKRREVAADTVGNCHVCVGLSIHHPRINDLGQSFREHSCVFFAGR